MYHDDSPTILPVCPQSILFVCTGNICRSVSAHTMMKAMLLKEGLSMYVDSAGIGARPGYHACASTLQLLNKKGFDASAHRSRKITRQFIDASDIIIAMEDIHREHIISEAPQAYSKIFLLSDFLPTPVGSSRESGIPDPIGRSAFFYENVNEMIELGCQGILSKLKENKPGLNLL